MGLPHSMCTTKPRRRFHQMRFSLCIVTLSSNLMIQYRSNYNTFCWPNAIKMVLPEVTQRWPHLLATILTPFNGVLFWSHDNFLFFRFLIQARDILKQRTSMPISVLSVYRHFADLLGTTHLHR